MSLKDNIWVYSDLAGRFAELSAGAAALGGKAQAMTIGSAGDAAAAAKSGVAKVHAISVADGKCAEAFIPDMASLIKGSGAPALVLVAATRRGRLVGAALAAALGAAVVSDVNGIILDGDSVTVTHSVYGGLAQGTEKVNTAGAVLLVAAGAFEAAGENAPAEIVDVSAAGAEGVKCLGRRAKQGSNVDLGRARRVVSVGRGLKAKEDLAMIEELAGALEAEVGCSRPLAEGENWLEHERYVGITGVKLKADLYVALGLSGQVQHMAGADSAKVIVAVNKDKNAPIFHYADYGLVGDIYKAVPALIKAFKG